MAAAADGTSAAASAGNSSSPRESQLPGPSSPKSSGSSSSRDHDKDAADSKTVLVTGVPQFWSKKKVYEHIVPLAGDGISSVEKQMKKYSAFINYDSSENAKTGAEKLHGVRLTAKGARGSLSARYVVKKERSQKTQQRRKRSRDDSRGAGPKRIPIKNMSEAPKLSLHDAITPLWGRPYDDQLRIKSAGVRRALKKMLRKLRLEVLDQTRRQLNLKPREAEEQLPEWLKERFTFVPAQELAAREREKAKARAHAEAGETAEAVAASGGASGVAGGTQASSSSSSAAPAAAKAQSTGGSSGTGPLTLEAASLRPRMDIGCNVEMLRIVPSPHLVGTRNKCSFSIEAPRAGSAEHAAGRRMVVGYRSGTHDGTSQAPVVSAASTLPTPWEAKAVLVTLEQLLESSPLGPSDDTASTGFWRQATIRTTEGASGGVLVVLHVRAHPPVPASGEQKVVKETGVAAAPAAVSESTPSSASSSSSSSAASSGPAASATAPAPAPAPASATGATVPVSGYPGDDEADGGAYRVPAAADVMHELERVAKALMETQHPPVDCCPAPVPSETNCGILRLMRENEEAKAANRRAEEEARARDARGKAEVGAGAGAGKAGAEGTRSGTQGPSGNQGTPSQDGQAGESGQTGYSGQTGESDSQPAAKRARTEAGAGSSSGAGMADASAASAAVTIQGTIQGTAESTGSKGQAPMESEEGAAEPYGAAQSTKGYLEAPPEEFLRVTGAPTVGPVELRRAALVTPGESPTKLAASPVRVTGVIAHFAPANHVMQTAGDADFVTLAGSGHVVETLRGQQFRVSPGAFFQTNAPGAARLFGIAGSFVRSGDLDVEGGDRFGEASAASAAIRSEPGGVSGEERKDQKVQPTVLLDVCCGTGAIGLGLAREVQAVIGVDISEQAIEDARVNAAVAGVTSAAFIASKAEDVAGQLGAFANAGGRRSGGGDSSQTLQFWREAAQKRREATQRAAEMGLMTGPSDGADGLGVPSSASESAAASGAADATAVPSVDSEPKFFVPPTGSRVVAVVDPPRSGLHPQVITAIRQLRSVRRLVYVSCNPTGSFVQDTIRLCKLATSSRKSLIRGDPFRLVRVVPVDMFPHTEHCELVALFERD